MTEAGGVGLPVPCDLARDTSVLGLFETVLGRFGRLDMLINNAAVSFGGDLDIEMKRYDVVMRVNVRPRCWPPAWHAPTWVERRTEDGS